MSTFCTAFSNDFLNRFICLKQKCHTTFMGRSQAYNMQHGYKTHCDKVMDKRRLSETYFKYILLLFKDRYGCPLTICGTIHEALEDDFDILYAAFQKKFGLHCCSVKGCADCLVIDGNMKAHRKVCKESGCSNDPKFKSIYCESHTKKDARAIDKNNVQEILNDDEYHIEKILSKSFNRLKKMAIQG